MRRLSEISGETAACTIGEAGRASGLSPRTIRYYERIGLIPRARRRNPQGAPRTGGDRVYTQDDIGRLRFIHQARQVDLGLAEIRELIAIADERRCPAQDPAYHEILDRHLTRLDARIARLVSLRHTVETLARRGRATGADGCTWSTCECMDTGGRADQPGSHVTVALLPAPRSKTWRSSGGKR